MIAGIKRYKNIASNAVYLSIVEAIRLLMPFIALPYIINIAGTENYGRIVFAQTVMAYFWIIVDCGLNVVAVKEIADNADDKGKLSRLVSSFFAIRFLLSIAGLAVLSGMIYFIPLFRENKWVMYFAYIGVMAESLTMTAFFQGIEKMQNITLVRFAAVVFYVAALFSFVKVRSDYIWIPFWQSAGLLISALIGVGLMRFKFGVKLQLSRLDDIKDMFRKTLPFLFSRISVVFNNNIAKLVSGFVLGMHEVALLDITQKIVGAVMTPSGIIDQAVYPHNAKNRDCRFATGAFWVLLGIGAAGSAAVYILCPWVIAWLGNNTLNDAIPLTRILCINIAVCYMTCYIGSPVLVAFGYPKPFNTSVIAAMCAVAACLLTGYYFDLLTLYSFIYLIMLGDLIILIHRMFYCVKYKLLFVCR